MASISTRWSGTSRAATPNRLAGGTGAVPSFAPAREIFSDVANKWALLIIEALGERTLRFTVLRDEVEGVSHKMLTQNLRMLERNGLVDRHVHPTVPPRVEYTLTESGRALRATVDAMCDWTHRYITDIDTARRRFDG